MGRTNGGRNIQGVMTGGGTMTGFAQTSAGAAPTATTFTDTGAAWPTTGDTLAGRVLQTGTVEMVIISNTATVATGYRWRNITTPTAGNGSTPGATVPYTISVSVAPFNFIGISANSSPAATDTALTGEISNASNAGLIRKPAPYAHTASAVTYTLTPVFTANANDTLPVTIASLGVFQDLSSVPTTPTGQPIFTTLLNVTATFNISGDQMTATETVTMA